MNKDIEIIDKIDYKLFEINKQISDIRESLTFMSNDKKRSAYIDLSFGIKLETKCLFFYHENKNLKGTIIRKSAIQPIHMLKLEIYNWVKYGDFLFYDHDEKINNQFKLDALNEKENNNMFLVNLYKLSDDLKIPTKFLFDANKINQVEFEYGTYNHLFDKTIFKNYEGKDIKLDIIDFIKWYRKYKNTYKNIEIKPLKDKKQHHLLMSFISSKETKLTSHLEFK